MALKFNIYWAKISADKMKTMKTMNELIEKARATTQFTTTANCPSVSRLKFNKSDWYCHNLILSLSMWCYYMYMVFIVDGEFNQHFTLFSFQCVINKIYFDADVMTMTKITSINEDNKSLLFMRDFQFTVLVHIKRGNPCSSTQYSR